MRRWQHTAFVAMTIAMAAAGRLVQGSGAATQRLTTLSIVGTTDVHGYVFPRDGRGGVELFGGYVANLRAARQADGGAVVLLDAGDTFQGGIESNLSEGGLVVDAYNALGYTAAAIGNHEFEFGAVDTWTLGPPAGSPDLRGALKARAAQARYPFLAANLHEAGVATSVAWPNVRPSVLVEAAGVKVGVVGVMTRDALAMTLAANVHGLAVSPLAPAVAAEATRLRAAGAQVVIVVAHAGGSCADLTSPTDLSSCDASAEMFDVVRALPRSLVNVVVAGHTHANVAHELEGVAIVQAGFWGRAFSRVDLRVDRAASTVADVHIFPPHDICTQDDGDTGRCAARGAPSAVPARYEGRPVAPDPMVTAAMTPALARVRELRAQPVGTDLAAPLTRGSGIDESPLANAFAEALRALTPGADAAITFGAGPGGMRVDLPAGPLTVGALYDVFPFDNRVVRMRVSGADLRRVLSTQVQRSFARGRAMGVSGLRVRVGCAHDDVDVHLSRPSGAPIADEEVLTLATLDFMVGRGGPFPVAAVNVVPAGDAALVRDVAWRWFQGQGRLDPERFASAGTPAWARAPGPSTCLD